MEESCLSHLCTISDPCSSLERHVKLLWLLNDPIEIERGIRKPESVLISWLKVQTKENTMLAAATKAKTSLALVLLANVLGKMSQLKSDFRTQCLSLWANQNKSNYRAGLWGVLRGDLREGIWAMQPGLVSVLLQPVIHRGTKSWGLS
jgi:hypothetical protein